MKTPLVSVVSLNHNRKDDIRSLIIKLNNQTYKNFEIIIVDNASTDGSCEMIRSEFPYVRLIELTKGIGIPGYNEGIKVARGEYVILIDSDAFLADNGIEKVVQKFEHPYNKNVGVVACRIVDANDGKTAPDSPNFIPEGNDEIGYPTYWFNGCGAGFRREVFEKAGYFTKYFFIYLLEIDLCIRILSQGYEIKVFPDIMVYHKKSPSLERDRHYYFYVTRNTIWFAQRNMPFKFKTSYLSKKLISNMIRSLLNDGFTHYLSGLKSGFSYCPREKASVIRPEVFRFIKKVEQESGQGYICSIKKLCHEVMEKIKK